MQIDKLIAELQQMKLTPGLAKDVMQAVSDALIRGLMDETGIQGSLTLQELDTSNASNTSSSGSAHSHICRHPYCYGAVQCYLPTKDLSVADCVTAHDKVKVYCANHKSTH